MSNCKHDEIMVSKKNTDMSTLLRSIALKHKYYNFSNGDKHVPMCPNKAFYTPPKFKVAITFE